VRAIVEAELNQRVEGGVAYASAIELTATVAGGVGSPNPCPNPARP